MTIASEIQRLQNSKNGIRDSIQNKWVTVPSDAKLDTYYSYIDQITSWWDDILSYMSGILSINTNMIWVSSSDNVQDRYGDFSTKNWQYLLLIKPYEYNDYSSSSNSHINTMCYCTALAKWWTSTIESDLLLYQGGWYTSTRLMYYYVFSNGAKFYGATWEYRDSYWCTTVQFNWSSRSRVQESWDGNTPSDTGGDMNLFSSSFIWTTSWRWEFYIKWIPV